MGKIKKATQKGASSFRVALKIKGYITALGLIFIPSFYLLFNFVPGMELPEDSFSDLMLKTIIFPAIMILVPLFFLLHNILTTSYLEVTENHIIYKTPFLKKKMEWKDIAAITLYHMNHSRYLGFLPASAFPWKQNNFYTIGTIQKYAFIVPEILLRGYDIEKLFVLLNEKLEEAGFFDEVVLGALENSTPTNTSKQVTQYNTKTHQYF